MHLEAVIERVWRCIWRLRSCNSEMHLEAVIERVWRCTWSPRSSNSEMHLEAVIERGLKMHLEAVIEQVWRCTWRPRSCYSEMQLEAVIERVWRCIWRPRSSNSEMHLEAVIERVWRCTWRPWSIEIGGVLGGSRLWGGRSGAKCDGSWDSIHWLIRNHGNVENWVQHGPLRAERLAVSGRQSILRWCSTRCMQYSVCAVLSVCCTRCMLYSVYAVLGVCCTGCMLYSVYAVLGVCCTRCMLYSVYAVLGVCCTQSQLLIMAWRDREGWLNFVLLGDCRVEDEKERDAEIIMRNWDLENFVCESIYHPRYGRYESRSGVELHQYEVFPTQSGKSYPRFLISARILHIVLIFIPHLALSRPQLYHHRRTQSSVIPLYVSMPWSWVDTEYSIHRVQHTPRTAYTKYSIHRVQYTPSTASTEYSIHWVQHPPKIVCLPFILMITRWPLNVASASGAPPHTINRHLLAPHESSKVKSSCHIPTFVSQLTDD